MGIWRTSKCDGGQGRRASLPMPGVDAPIRELAHRPQDRRATGPVTNGTRRSPRATRWPGQRSTRRWMTRLQAGAQLLPDGGQARAPQYARLASSTTCMSTSPRRSPYSRSSTNAGISVRPTARPWLSPGKGPSGWLTSQASAAAFHATGSSGADNASCALEASARQRPVLAKTACSVVAGYSGPGTRYVCVTASSRATPAASAAAGTRRPRSVRCSP
jgi:hypothetical protein